MVLTRLQEATMQSTPDDASSSSAGAAGPLPPSADDHFTPPEHFVPQPNAELILNAPRSPERRPRQPRAPRDPPDIADVLTQQTAVLARMMEQLQNRDPPTRPQAANDPADPPEDPNFLWERLAMASETNFVVPSTGMVQQMVTSLFSKIPTLTGRDQHEARFVLQVVSL